MPNNILSDFDVQVRQEPDGTFGVWITNKNGKPMPVIKYPTRQAANERASVIKKSLSIIRDQLPSNQ